jgi:hypothetical protein
MFEKAALMRRAKKQNEYAKRNAAAYQHRRQIGAAIQKKLPLYKSTATATTTNKTALPLYKSTVCKEHGK